MKKTILLIFLSPLVACACVSPSVISRTRTVYAPQFVFAQKLFVAAPTQQQSLSPEYEKYIQLIAGQLAAHGMIQTSDAAQADYALYITYGTEKAVARLPGEKAPPRELPSAAQIIRLIKPSQELSNAKLSTPTAPTDSVAANPKQAQEELLYPGFMYMRFMTLQLTDLKAPAPSENDATTFTAIVESEGSTPSLEVVSACLVNALFNGFPGKNGATKKVRLDYASCAEENDAE